MAHDDDWIDDLHWNSLTTAVTLLERTLWEERERVVDRCKRELETTRENIVETADSIEITVSARHHEIATEIEQIADEIPRLLMNNMLVSAWTLFETKMIGVTRGRLIGEKDLSDESFREADRIQTLEHIEEFLNSRGISMPRGWDLANTIRQIRHQIIHDAAFQHEVDDVTDPIELRRHKRTAGIMKFIAEREAKGKSGIWYRHGGLYVSANFCREVIEFFRGYVKATSGLAAIPFKDEPLLRRIRASENRVK